MSLPSGVLVGWVGDDFTGSAATMEVMAFAGLPSVLFNGIPTEAQRARFDGVRGIGIATTARAHGTGWMERTLPTAYHALTNENAALVHYKTCSTLDSAPHVGSIGRAIDIGLSAMAGPWVPFLVAAPQMRRYQAFGHLFAGAPEGVFRLDRHPVMARHPVTPMDESDVARHIARQTRLACAALTVEDLATGAEAALQARVRDGAQVITLDAMDGGHMFTNGRLLWEHRDTARFVAGSQGIEYALVAYWRAMGLLPDEPPAPSAGPAKRMLAVSGSVSPVTARQIAWAEANGFGVIRLDAARVARGEPEAQTAACTEALAVLDRGLDPLIVTARGPDDPAVTAFRQSVADARLKPEDANTRVGEALGRILKRLLVQTGIRRAVISGGDTSGAATEQLGLFAYTALAPTIPGAALLTAHSEDPQIDGLQIALKGGQMGSDDYFGWIKRGGGAARGETS